MSTTTKAITARIAHLCEGCYTVPSDHNVPTIAPGHRYLRHTAFPDGDINTSDRPFSVTECVACLANRDETAPLLVAGACSTFCCGDVPCARPFGHDGDHECQRCLDRVEVSA
ncbi:hypothetical protein [Micromonospora sp. L32]|uniref:hypothetical protein n=1 Tax=Micromonospora sp. L32 TaxID=3452214 RepID=UPI003F8A959E